MHLKETGGIVTDNYTNNKLNQTTAIGSLSFGYDDNGNLTSRNDGTNTQTFTWDWSNRLTGVQNPTSNIQYRYNHNDLRIEKAINNQPSTINRYYYNGSRLLAEGTVEGSTVRINKVYMGDDEGVLGMTRLIYKNDALKTFSHYYPMYYLFNELGSVEAITDNTGLPIMYYQYDAYGQLTNTTNDPVNGLSFVGRYGGYKDWDTGLTYFWHRWYDASTGKFVSRDPIGIKVDVNLYGYTKQNVINKIDPSGLAYFAKKRIFVSKEEADFWNDPLADLVNVEYVHEQIFFEDGKTPTNIGFGPAQENWKAIFLVEGDYLYEEPENYYKYTPDPKHYNDCIMREAYPRVKLKKYSLTNDWGGENCQSWAVS